MSFKSILSEEKAKNGSNKNIDNNKFLQPIEVTPPSSSKYNSLGGENYEEKKLIEVHFDDDDDDKNSRYNPSTIESSPVSNQKSERLFEKVIENEQVDIVVIPDDLF